MKPTVAICAGLAVALSVVQGRGETIIGFDTLWGGHAINFEQDSIYTLERIDTADTQWHDFILSFGVCFLKTRSRANDACVWLYGMRRGAYFSVVRFQDTDFDQPLDVSNDATFKPVYETIGDRAADWECDSPYVCFEHPGLVWNATGTWAAPDLFYILRTKAGNYVVIQTFDEIHYDCTDQSPMSCHENLEALVLRWFLQTDGSTSFDVPPTEDRPQAISASGLRGQRIRGFRMYDCLGRPVSRLRGASAGRGGRFPNGVYIASSEGVARVVYVTVR
jgi:hypothetical protein